MREGVPIRADVHDRVSVITIDRAEKANALTETAKGTLAHEINRTASDDHIQAVVVTGDGDRTFCAGSDIREMQGFDGPAMYRMLGAERAMYLAALESPKPVVAAVNGHALGAGLNFAMCCDYAVASSAARFGAPELSIGVADPLEGLLLPWVVGLGRARAMFYGARHLDAAEAADVGLIHEITEPSACLRRAIEVAREIGTLPSNAFTIQKSLLRRLVAGDGLEAVIEASRYATSLQFADGQTAQAMARFLARRQ